MSYLCHELFDTVSCSLYSHFHVHHPRHGKFVYHSDLITVDSAAVLRTRLFLNRFNLLNCYNKSKIKLSQ